MLKVIIAFVFAVSTVPASAFAGKSAPPVFSVKEIAAIFESVGNLENSAYILSKKVSPKEFRNISKLLKKHDISLKQKMPDFVIEGHFLFFKDLKKKFDLTKIAQGEIFDGTSYWRYSKKNSADENLESLLKFMAGKKVSLFNVFVGEAHAIDVNLDPVFKVLFAIGIPIMSVMALYMAAPLVLTGITVAKGLVLVAAAIALYGIVSWLYNSGMREVMSQELVCENGELVLKNSYSKEKLWSHMKDRTDPEYVGRIEMLVRKDICENKEMYEGFVSMVMTPLKKSGAEIIEKVRNHQEKGDSGAK
jgi:hypothetical protein